MNHLAQGIDMLDRRCKLIHARGIDNTGQFVAEADNGHAYLTTST